MTRDEALTLAIRTLADAVLHLDNDPEYAKTLAQEAKEVASHWGKP